MTTWPDVVEAAAKLWNDRAPVREFRMNATTRDELMRQLNLVRPAGDPPVPPIEGGMQGTLFGTPVLLDEAVADMQWKALGRDGAIIQAGSL